MSKHRVSPQTLNYINDTELLQGETDRLSVMNLDSLRIHAPIYLFYKTPCFLFLKSMVGYKTLQSLIVSALSYHPTRFLAGFDCLFSELAFCPFSHLWSSCPTNNEKLHDVLSIMTKGLGINHMKKSILNTSSIAFLVSINK